LKKDPTIASQIAYYDRWNENHRAGQLSEIDVEIRVRGMHVLEHVRALRIQQPKILEVGCGTGWLTESLQELGSVTAIDLSPRAIEIARTRGINAGFIAGDFFQQDFTLQAYDVVICIETLFYVSDQHSFLEKMASLMKPGSLLAISTINKFVYERSSDIGPPEEGQVRYWLSKREILDMLAPYFDLVSMETLEPRGNLGILRLVNSYKLNAILGFIFSEQRIKRTKEYLGLGGGIVIIARRKMDS